MNYVRLASHDEIDTASHLWQWQQEQVALMVASESAVEIVSACDSEADPLTISHK